MFLYNNNININGPHAKGGTQPPWAVSVKWRNITYPPKLTHYWKTYKILSELNSSYIKDKKFPPTPLKFIINPSPLMRIILVYINLLTLSMCPLFSPMVCHSQNTYPLWYYKTLYNHTQSLYNRRSFCVWYLPTMECKQMQYRAFMQVLLNKLMDWLMIIMILVVTLVVPSVIDNL